jgi:two-component system chemotaxis sensor kinase CheA
VIRADQVERSDGQEVLQYRGGILPLVRLSGSTLSEKETLQMVVCRSGGRGVGLVIDRILDIVETSADVAGVGRGDGLLGTTVIQEHVTDLLDVPAILRSATAERFAVAAREVVA